ncbi:hypothetical protein Tco_0322525 [Tanacetum coccineum]
MSNSAIYRDSVQIVENELGREEVPENDMDVKMFPRRMTLSVNGPGEAIHPHKVATTTLVFRLLRRHRRRLARQTTWLEGRTNIFITGDMQSPDQDVIHGSSSSNVTLSLN